MPQLRLQPLSNTGTIQPNAVLYVFNAGTTTQASTYTDSTGIILNPNPIPADSSGRLPQVWLLNQFYKFQLCVQNDGATCASGDTLYTVDNVPGFGGGSSGSSSSPFISASANPATSGILRLASGDSFCFRNNANNANLCFSKNTNDLFSWAGGSMLFPEVTAPSGVAASDLLYADNSAHRWAMSNNGGTVDTVVGRNSPDAFTNKTFNTGASGNVFQIAGTGITAVTGSGSVVLAASPSITGTVGGSATYSSITATSPTFNSGVANNGTGLQHIRFTGCTNTAHFCDGTANWNSTWANTSYTVVCSAVINSSGSTNGQFISINSKSTTQIGYHVEQIVNNVVSAAEIDCTGIHD
jgi:hypothetical protein